MPKIRIDAGFFLWAAFLLMLLPARWLAAAFFAGCFHELCHYAAAVIMGVRVYSIHVGAGGAIMETEPMSRQQELAAALAGPIGGLLPVILIRHMPILALCSLVHSLYNLIPVYPLDGGRALRCALEGLLSERHANSVCEAIHILTVMLLGITGLYAFVKLKLGILPLFPFIFALRILLVGKIPCKTGLQKVQ